MKIGIVVLNYNSKKDTVECLNSLEKLQIKDNVLEVIVVDNGSIPEFKIHPTVGESKFKIDLKVIRNEVNLGFAGGNNVGIKYVLNQKADYVLILNNDTIVDKNLIEELIKTGETDKKIGILVPKIYFAKGHEFHKDRYKENEKGSVIWYGGGIMDWKNLIGFHKSVDEVDSEQVNKEEETEIATGCAMLVKKEVFEKIGFFDDKYFLYYEDSDFSIRAKNARYKIVYCPKAILWHKNAGSAGGSGSSLQDYYITRNRLMFGFRYACLRTKIALVKETIKIFLSGRKWQKKGVSDFYLGKLGKGSYT